MTTVPAEDRTPEQRARDETIAAEPPLPLPDLLPPGVTLVPMESLLRCGRRPVAVAGVVENGLVRPLDPMVRLPEGSPVIIVTTQPE